MEKKIVSILILCFIVVFTGCSIKKNQEKEVSKSDGNSETQINEKSNKSDDIVELNYMTWNTEDAYAKEVVDNFNNSQNHIHINYISEPTEGDAFQSKVLTLLSSESDIDILGIYPNPTLFRRYCELGALEPLDSLINEYSLDLKPYGISLAPFKQDNHYYALPHRKSVEVLYYNQDMFDELNVEVPKQVTWDDFLTIAKKMTHKDKSGRDIKGCVGDIRFWAQADVTLLTAQYGELLTDAEIPHLKTVLERVNKIFNVDRSTTDYAEMIAMGNAGQTQLFFDGEAAMLPSADFMLSLLTDKSKCSINWNVGFLPYDPEDMDKFTSYGGSTGTGITSFCKHKKEAFEFLSFLCGSDGAKLIASKSVLPAYSSDEVLKEFQSVLPENIDVEPFIKSNPMPYNINTSKSSELTEMMNEEMEKMLIGSQLLEETYSNIESKRKEILDIK